MSSSSPSRTACRLRAAMIVVGLIASTAAPALTADQTILGSTLVVKNPRADEPARRKILITARETNSPNIVIGNANSGGALLEIVANGAASSAQVFPLPQGTSSSGRPFWSVTGSLGYRYTDPLGEQGPVRSVLIKKGRSGTFRIKAKIQAGPWIVDIVPPNSGTDGFLTLTLSGGDRYCVQFGAEGQQTNRGDKLWKMRQVTAQGCPSAQPSSGEFLALTYNVAGLPMPFSGSTPLVNTPIISPRLNAYDMVFIQESWLTPDPNPLAPLRAYHELLVADALHPYKSTPAPQPINSDPRRDSAVVSDGLNLFSNFAFDPDVIREMWTDCFNSAADCFSQKGFMVARTTLARGVTVDIYDLHGEAGGSPQDDVLRAADMVQLADYMATYSAGRAIIVGGDFNLHTNDPLDGSIYNQLLDTIGLTDACTAVSCGDTGRIDKFAFRSSPTLQIAPTEWRNDTLLFRDANNVELSDHDPVAVRFTWSVEP